MQPGRRAEGGFGTAPRGEAEGTLPDDRRHLLDAERNEHAKAGNINASFAKIKGDLVAILDADHVPSSDFLRKTVGFFVKDPGMALVQTPHFFLNPDPVEYNLKTFPRMPSENELFYRNIQPGLDRWNAAFFCGSAALLRRSALDEVGGISGNSITEDCETAMDLHAQGYRSAYLDQPLIAGLQPESFVSFIGQRSRWAQGMIQILLLKNVLWRSGLSLAQRLCYLSNSLYWFFVFIRPIFVLGPLCYLFFGLQIVRTNVPEFFAYILPHIVASVMLPNILNGKVRWPFISELYEYVLSLHLSRAVLSVLINPRAPQFKVTAKGETTTSDRASPLAGPFVWMVLLLTAGMVAAAWRFVALPESREIIGIVAFWNSVSLLLALAGLGAVYEQRQIRKFPRINLQVPAHLKLDGGDFPAQVVNGSANGLNIEPDACPVADVGIDDRDPAGAGRGRRHRAADHPAGPAHVGLGRRLLGRMRIQPGQPDRGDGRRPARLRQQPYLGQALAQPGAGGKIHLPQLLVPGRPSAGPRRPGRLENVQKRHSADCLPEEDFRYGARPMTAPTSRNSRLPTRIAATSALWLTAALPVATLPAHAQQPASPCRPLPGRRSRSRRFPCWRLPTRRSA